MRAVSACHAGRTHAAARTIELVFDSNMTASRGHSAAWRGYAESVARSAADIALELRRRSPGIGVKKLHKLLYYCQGHHLSGVGRQLFSESVSAWDMGPVVGQLWKAEKEASPTGRVVELDEAELNTIGYVLSRYGRLTARDLEHMTHAEQPWLRADERRPQGGSAQIRTEWMREYFEAERESEDDPGPDAERIREFVEGAAERLRDSVGPDSVEGLRSRISPHG
jgi:uncharacterized phage-associated protein